MPDTSRPIPEIQDDCAAIAAALESVAQRLVQLRRSLRLPADTLAIVEEDGAPWPIEVAVDAALGTALDDEVGPAADRLRQAARLTDEQLRRRHAARNAN